MGNFPLYASMLYSELMEQEKLVELSSLPLSEGNAESIPIRDLLLGRVDSFFASQKNSLLRTFESHQSTVQADIKQYAKRHEETRATIATLPDAILKLIWSETISSLDLVDILDNFRQGVLKFTAVDNTIAVVTRMRLARSQITGMPDYLVVKALSQPQRYIFHELQDGGSLIVIVQSPDQEVHSR